jgi:hypothetical protein
VGLNILYEIKHFKIPIYNNYGKTKVGLDLYQRSITL